MTGESSMTVDHPESFAGTFSHHNCRLQDVQLHYVIGGRGEPVVLLHGWPQTWFEWRRVMPGLAERYTVIAPDLRGLGDSSRPDAGYDLRTLSGDIRRLVEHLGLGAVRLVGHDLGGPVAYAYAAQWPGDVKRLAVVDAPLLGVRVEGVEDLNHQLWHFAFHQAPDVPEALVAGRERMYLTWFYKTFAYDKAAVGEAEIAEYVRCYSAPGGLRAGFAHYRAFPEDGRQVGEWARTKLKMPVLALGGEFSLRDITLKLYEAVAEEVRGGVISQCGHWVAEERPDYLLDQLPSFFAP
jgi:pimeloyl-ACP methyl ester carboxylesterase